MSKHSSEIVENMTNEEVSIKIGDLYYDDLDLFLKDLSSKLDGDGVADFGRNRPKLAAELKNAAKHIKEASKHIRKAWNICKPHTTKD